MNEGMDLPAMDALIHQARAKFRAMLAADTSLFGGADNPCINATIGADAALGSIDVPAGIDTASTQGLMRAVDLTLLDHDAPAEAVTALAQRAHKEHAAAVCVYPVHVPLVQEVTGGNPPAIAVVGFPAVPNPTDALPQTLEETRMAIGAGAREIDMVLALDFKNGNPDYAAHYRYIRQVVTEAAQHHVPVKVILETAYLTDPQKVEACLLVKMAGAAFVKTSTGFAEESLMNPHIPAEQKGATVSDVMLMRRAVGDTTLDETGNTAPMGVKASGGVRNRAQAISFYESGASRIGASMGLDVQTMLEKVTQRSTHAGQQQKGIY